METYLHLNAKEKQQEQKHLLQTRDAIQKTSFHHRQKLAVKYLKEIAYRQITSSEPSSSWENPKYSVCRNKYPKQNLLHSK